MSTPRANTVRGANSAVRPNPVLTAGLLVLLCGLAYLPFVYRGAFGEWDSYRMANGVLRTLASGHWFDPAVLYNLKYSFGYYALLYLFAPVLKSNPGSIFPIMNWISVAAAMLATIPFFALVQRFWGTLTAAVAVITLIFIPSWWHLCLYGHPMTPAMLLMLTGLALIAYRSRLLAVRRSRWHHLGFDLAVIASLALALTFRLDTVLMFPLVTACLLLEGRSFGRSLARSFVYAAGAVAVFFIARALLVDSPLAGTATTVFAWHNPLKSPAMDLPRGLAIFGLATHPLNVFVFGIACVAMVKRRETKTLFFVVPVFLINALFWLPNPAPARHFVYATPVLAVGVAWLIADRGWRRRAPRGGSRLLAPLPLAFVLVGVSALFSELTYPIVRARYPWKSRPQNFSARAPIRWAPLNKRYTEAYYKIAARFAGDLVRLERRDRPIFVIADPQPTMLALQTAIGDLRITPRQIPESPTLAYTYHIESGDHEFIVVEPSGLATLLGSSNAYDGDYLVIDPYNPNFEDVDTHALARRLQLLATTTEKQGG